MAMRASHLLRLGLMVTMLGACGDDTSNVFPEEDASPAEDAPTFDVPSMDSGNDVGTVDRGTTDIQRVDRGPTPDRGGGDCPASCTTSAECDPCRTADTPDTVRYCCISGLCVSMTGSCSVAGDGGGGTDGSSDAAEGGGADAPDFDDVPEDDAGDKDADTPPPPVDADTDAGTDASTDAGGIDGSSSTMDASVMDASTAG